MPQKIKLNKDWKFKEAFPSISAYTTTFNCISGNYPFIDAIKSFAWCDEIVVAEGGSTDGTKEALEKLCVEMPNLRVYEIGLSENPGKDGELKAMARAMCSSEFLVQFDSDEICVGDSAKWKKIAKTFPEGEQMMNLLVLEPLGSLTNLRMNESHNNLKWRVSRNLPEITHAIPDYDRVEKDGKVYSSGKSDGCFPCHIVTNKLTPTLTRDLEVIATQLKSTGKKNDYKAYVAQLISENEPMILHLGHVKLEEKIKLYLKSWHNWWCDLYGKDPADPANNQYFPGVKLEDVTQEMVDKKVKEMIDSTPSVVVPEIESCLRQNA